jgi:hypothetical protein
VEGLAPASDYTVCFFYWSGGLTGGSADAFGYRGQCYGDQPSGTPTMVTVGLGATTDGIDVVLAAGGAISGVVTEAGGTQHGLADVQVSASSPSTGDVGTDYTAADGSYTVKGLAAGTDYTVCFNPSWGGGGVTGGSTDEDGYPGECYDNQPSGTPTLVTVALGATRAGTDAALGSYGAITGTVTEAEGTHHGLAGVQVVASSQSQSRYGFATTAEDGSYTVTGLAATTDYQVCFSPSGATGGSADAAGYLDQCYDKRPGQDTGTPVTVALNATTVGIDVALTTYGAISGVVTEAGGSQHGLAGVYVEATSPSAWYPGVASTTADGSYILRGLPAGTDYRVCFYPSFGTVTGGSANQFGYSDQCYDNQSVVGTPTPVSVRGGATKAGIDAALLYRLP